MNIAAVDTLMSIFGLRREKMNKLLEIIDKQLWVIYLDDYKDDPEENFPLFVAQLIDVKCDRKFKKIVKDWIKEKESK